MKLLPLIESSTTARQVALDLQQLLLGYDVFDDIDLTSIIPPEKAASRIDGVSMQLKGPLVDFYLNVIKKSSIISGGNIVWLLNLNTSKSVLLDDEFNLITFASDDPTSWFKSKLIDNLMTIMARVMRKENAAFWFYKIANSLPQGFTLMPYSIRSNHTAVNATIEARIIVQPSGQLFKLELIHNISNDELIFQLDGTEVTTIEQLNKLLLKSEQDSAPL